MSQPSQDELQARYEGLNAAAETLGKELLILEPGLIGVTIITTWESDAEKRPRAQFLTRSPRGDLTPLVAGRILADCANCCGQLSTALMKTAQEIDHVLAARTRDAQTLAEQQAPQAEENDRQNAAKGS